MPAAHNCSIRISVERLPWRESASVGGRPLLAYFVERLADTRSGDIFEGRLTMTRCAIVDPGPF
jgi:hypothetical protein